MILTLLIATGAVARVGMAGGDTQKEAILPGVAAGRTRLAFGETEPEAGSDANGIECRANGAGDGYKLNGITVGQYAGGTAAIQRNRIAGQLGLGRNG